MRTRITLNASTVYAVFVFSFLHFKTQGLFAAFSLTLEMLQFKRKSVLQVAKKCKCLRMFSKGLYSLQHKNCYCNTACNKIKLFFFLHQQKYVSTELIMNQLGQVSAISFWQQNET